MLLCNIEISSAVWSFRASEMLFATIENPALLILEEDNLMEWGELHGLAVSEEACHSHQAIIIIVSNVLCIQWSVCCVL